MRNAKLMGLVEEMVFTMEAINKSVEIKLKYWPESSPIEGQDIQWLKYIWECSDGKEVYVYEDKIPDNLRHTVIFQFLIERFLFYKDSQKLFSDFEYDQKNRCYYIVLENGFVTLLNLMIDNVNYKSYIPEFQISHVQEKGQIIMSTINNKGTFNGPVNNQIGNQNSNTQSSGDKKESSIKINFLAMFKALLKKIPFLGNYVE